MTLRDFAPTPTVVIRCPESVRDYLLQVCHNHGCRTDAEALALWAQAHRDGGLRSLYEQLGPARKVVKPLKNKRCMRKCNTK